MISLTTFDNVPIRGGGLAMDCATGGRSAASAGCKSDEGLR